jgi:hypothetical protein
MTITEDDVKLAKKCAIKKLADNLTFFIKDEDSEPVSAIDTERDLYKAIEAVYEAAATEAYYMLTETAAVIALPGIIIGKLASTPCNRLALKPLLRGLHKFEEQDVQHVLEMLQDKEIISIYKEGEYPALQVEYCKLI